MEERSSRILFVEDEQWFMGGIVDYLVDIEGYEVLKARTTTEGLERLESETVDLVLLDIMMQAGPRVPDAAFGRESGVELCRIIRKDLKLDVPIVCLTVVTDESIHEKLANLGAIVLVKPTLNRDIAKTISSALRDSYRRG